MERNRRGGRRVRAEPLKARREGRGPGIDPLSGRRDKPWPLRLIPFLGPAFVASVAYVDPGNFATNIQAGARFGYMLLWVIVASNLMAMLIQTLSAKLGIATGRNLAQVCRARFPRPVVWAMWVVSELVAMATDLAELLGAAIGFNLLFGLPLFPAALLTALITLVILALQRRGFRPIEAVITALIGVIAVSYLIETVLETPDWGAVARAAVTPRLVGGEAVLLAVGILGATVMPHVIFLHSSLMQNRIRPTSPSEARQFFRFELVDVVIAMGIAGLINGAMLIMAAATFHARGLAEVASIEAAYRTLVPLLGRFAGTVFALALLAAGLSSSAVGTMAGQVIMQGFLERRVPLWVRRLVTMLPALVVIALGLDPTRTLVISQVVLSFGIPVALIPLIVFTRDRDLMGDLTNRRLTTAATVVAAAFIILLNALLLINVIAGGGP